MKLLLSNHAKLITTFKKAVSFLKSMQYIRRGYPEVAEVVMCTVTKVYPNSVFVNIDEFGQLSGMISISEISPGRIRNIRDFVSEGKVIFCKVLYVNRERSHVELSLRRVSESMRRGKSNELKKELTAEKIIEFVAKKHGKTEEQLYHEISPKIFLKYKYICELFDEVAGAGATLDEYVPDKAMAKDLVETIKQRLKPAEVKLQGTISISSYLPDGVYLIREAFVEIAKNKTITIHYLGGGKFNIEIVGTEFKKMEKELNEEVGKIITFVEKKGGTATFEKTEAK